MNKYLTLALAVISAAACSKEMQETVPDVQKAPEGKVFRTFTVSREATRGDICGTELKWELGDSIAVFDNVNPKDTNKFKVTTIEGNAIEITGTVSETATRFKAVYPYNAFVNNEVGDSIKVTVSGYQYIPADRQIDPRYLVAVASSDGMDFTFRNVFSLLRFTVTREEISAVKFFATKGNAIVKAATANLVKAADYNPVIVRPKDSTYFTPGEYYAAVLPCTMQGLDVVCTQGTGNLSWKQNTTDTLVFRRNGGYDVGTVDDGRQLLAKWILRKPYHTDNSTNYACKTTAVGYGKNAAGNEAYVSSDFAGYGKIKYYAATTSSCTRKIETSATSLYSLTGGGAKKGDYWDFSVKRQIPAGTTLHIRFRTNSSSAPKHMELQYSEDGSSWKASDTIELPNTGVYTCTVDKTWVIKKDIAGDDYVSLFRMVKVTEDGGWPRILENPTLGGFDWAPYIEIIED